MGFGCGVLDGDGLIRFIRIIHLFNVFWMGSIMNMLLLTDGFSRLRNVNQPNAQFFGRRMNFKWGVRIVAVLRNKLWPVQLIIRQAEQEHVA